MQQVRSLIDGRELLGDGALDDVDPSTGGVKNSGSRREKGFEALLGFCQTRTVALFAGES